MRGLSLQRLRADGEAFMKAISREGYLALARRDTALAIRQFTTTADTLHEWPSAETSASA